MTAPRRAARAACAPPSSQCRSAALNQTGVAATPGDQVASRAGFAFDSAAHAFTRAIAAPGGRRHVRRSLRGDQHRWRRRERGSALGDRG